MKKISALKSEILQIFTALIGKRCGCFMVKIVLFSPLLTANLTFFSDQTSTRVEHFTEMIVSTDRITRMSINQKIFDGAHPISFVKIQHFKK